MNIKKLRELKKNKKGFTLIEIIVVVVILAVLMAVAVPSVLNYLDEADNAKYMSQARGAYTVMQKELTDAIVKDTDRKIDSDQIEAVLKACEFEGTPAVVASGISLTEVTKDNLSTVVYYVKFDNTHYAKLTPNEDVEILGAAPDGITITNVSTGG